MSISSKTGNKTATHEERGLDLYETPAVAVDALLKCERLPHHIWEPACGPGLIVRKLRAKGHTVFASDIEAYGCPQSEQLNFLAQKQQRIDVEAIVTNPPYRYAQAFVENGLFHAPLVIMLLRLAFLESVRRNGILDGGKLARVHVFRNRLPMMHRYGWAGPKASSAMAFAWFVWDRFWKGPTIIDRISWVPEAANDNEVQPHLLFGMRGLAENENGSCIAIDGQGCNSLA